MKPKQISKRASLPTSELVQTLMAVDSHGSMTAAAKVMYMTTPTVLNRLRVLEKRMGQEVIKHGRRFKPVQLTQYGRQLCREARQRDVMTEAEGKLADSRVKYPTGVSLLEGGANVHAAAKAQGVSYTVIARVNGYLQEVNELGW